MRNDTSFFHHFISFSRFLNNIADTNEPTSDAVKMHRALFDDCDKNKMKLSSEQSEAFSINRNLVQRKHELVGGNNIEMNSEVDVNTKIINDGIDSISLASFDDNRRKFNHFKMTNDRMRNPLANKTQKFNNHAAGNAQSFTDFFKSIFRCNSVKKINEQIQSDYPLNLHLRMNEIFSMHDKLSDISENLNDLYSAGRCFCFFLKTSGSKRRKFLFILRKLNFISFHPFSWETIIFLTDFISFFLLLLLTFLRFFAWRNCDLHNGRFCYGSLWHFLRDKGEENGWN